VAEDITNPFAQIIGALQSRNDARGVRKDTKPGEVSPTLTTQEKSRYEKIFGIMKDVLAPSPEAQKVSRTGTATGRVGSVKEMQAAATISTGDGFDFGSALGTLALVGGVIGAAASAVIEDLKGKFTDIALSIGEFGAVVATDIGNLPAMAAKLGRFLLPRLKFIPFLGSLINFGMAAAYGLGLGGYQQDLPRAAWELVSGIANLVPGAQAISIAMDGVSLLYEMQKSDAIKRGEEPPEFGTYLKDLAVTIGTKSYEAIKAGKVPVLSSLFKFGEGLGYMLTGDFSKGFESWSMILPVLLGDLTNNENFLLAFDAFTTMLGDKTYNAYATAKTMAGNAWGWMKGMFEKIGGVFVKIFDAISDWIDETIQAGKDLIWDMIPDIFKSGGENKLNPTYTPPSGSSTGFYAPYSGHVQDGMISKDGKVTTFDGEDDLLAAKRGGPIDRMLSNKNNINIDDSKIVNELNEVNKNQLNVLIAIRDGIDTLVSRSGSTNVQFKSNPLTQEFYA